MRRVNIFPPVIISVIAPNNKDLIFLMNNNKKECKAKESFFLRLFRSCQEMKSDKNW